MGREVGKQGNLVLGSTEILLLKPNTDNSLSVSQMGDCPGIGEESLRCLSPTSYYTI